MPNPISNLTATWVSGTGIELDWTAATDATNDSFYLVYVLINVSTTTPTWTLVATLGAEIVNGPEGIVALAPSTSYQYPWSSATVLWASGIVAPSSLAFQVLQSDDLGNTSTGVTVSAISPAQTFPTAPPHLQNIPAIDAFGQFLVNNQDSYSEVADSVEMIVGTQIGQRPALPDFGILDPTFTYPIDTDSMRASIVNWDDRAVPTITASYEDVVGGLESELIELATTNADSGAGSFNG